MSIARALPRADLRFGLFLLFSIFFLILALTPESLFGQVAPGELELEGTVEVLHKDRHDDGVTVTGNYNSATASA